MLTAEKLCNYYVSHKKVVHLRWHNRKVVPLDSNYSACAIRTASKYSQRMRTRHRASAHTHTHAKLLSE